MLCGTCENDPCACTKANPIFRSTERSRPADAITKEEFGLALYAAIFAIGGILGLQEQYAGHVKYGNKARMKEALVKRDQLKRELAPQLDKLSDADAAEIVRRYPWVLQ